MTYFVFKKEKEFFVLINEKRISEKVYVDHILKENEVYVAANTTSIFQNEEVELVKKCKTLVEAARVLDSSRLSGQKTLEEI